ncbi:hypothetical protein ABEB36_001293 [Hypothenemus hampei]|uniref:Transcription initiation factor TFIID subunit 8 n=1 Tax=Hypothenemus hampei TaxID=57062 RepID=A0ABD1FHC2_HYPHA
MLKVQDLFENLDEKEKAILKVCHELEKQSFEVELLKKEIKFKDDLKKTEITFKEKECELLLKYNKLECEMRIFRQQLETINWEKVKQEMLLDIRNFIDFFDRRHLNKNIPERGERFFDFVKNNSEKLIEWNLDPNNFKYIFTSFYKKLCEAAHNIFNVGGTLVVEENKLQIMELRVVGFLWDVFPLPKERLFLRKHDNSLIAIFELKNRCYVRLYRNGLLENYVKSGKHTLLPSLHQQQTQKELNMLLAGSKEPLPSHIPKHLPAFPDRHEYVRTSKDIEKVFTTFLAKPSDTHYLFDTDDGNNFPLIATKPLYPPYLSALLPQDQIFDPEDLDFDPKTQIFQ